MSARHRSHREGSTRLRVWLIGLLVVLTSAMTVTNVAATMEQRRTATPAAYRPLAGYGTSELVGIARQHGPTAQRRFLFYLELGQAAPRGSLTVFPEAGLHEERLLGLGRLEALEVSDYDPGLSPEAEAKLRERSLFEGEADLRGGTRDYVIVADPPERELVLHRGHDGTLFVVPSRALDTEDRDGGD